MAPSPIDTVPLDQPVGAATSSVMPSRVVVDRMVMAVPTLSLPVGVAPFMPESDPPANVRFAIWPSVALLVPERITSVLALSESEPVPDSVAIVRLPTGTAASKFTAAGVLMHTTSPGTGEVLFCQLVALLQLELPAPPSHVLVQITAADAVPPPSSQPAAISAVIVSSNRGVRRCGSDRARPVAVPADI